MIIRERRGGGEARGNEERRRERIEKGSRERIERKETKGNRDDNLKRRRKKIYTCLCLLFSFLHTEDHN